jgi:outer membrane lipoprotein-sorting protein
MTMKSFRCFSAAVLIATAVAAHAQGSRLETVLHQMDEASAKFQSTQADLHKDLYERVTRGTTTQLGTVYFLRKGTTTQMGAKFTAPSPRTIEVKDGVVRLFDAVPDHLTEISIKANQAQYDTFFTLGFGGSGKDLASAWTITDQGPETINDGKQAVATEKLDLVSKDPGSRNTFTHILIWIDPVRSIALKQQFFTPSGDMQTAIYSNIRYNQKLDMGAFAIKTDKKTTIDRR